LKFTTDYELITSYAVIGVWLAISIEKLSNPFWSYVDEVCDVLPFMIG